MKKGLVIQLAILVFIFIVIPNGLLFADDTIVQLENGKTILLHDDFTWEYLDTTENNFDLSQIRDNEIPSFLRQGIAVKAETIIRVVINPILISMYITTL